ncbi:MAG: hypothetical protein ABI185_00515 [Ginsengibacter sp.]
MPLDFAVTLEEVPPKVNPKLFEPLRQLIPGESLASVKRNVISF